jgi:hypothetical protein
MRLAAKLAGRAARFERKQQGRSRRRNDALDNHEVEPTFVAEEFHVTSNAHAENSGTHRRKHR